MLDISQLLKSHHPQANPHGISSINWLKQHYHDNALGAHIKTLAESIDAAGVAGKPYTLELSGADKSNGQIGPYHLTPVWDGIRRELKLEISNGQEASPDNHTITTIGVPLALIKSHLATATKQGATDNERKVAAQTGACALRDYMMNHNITPSESLARGLFDALACIAITQRASRGLH